MKKLKKSGLITLITAFNISKIRKSKVCYTKQLAIFQKWGRSNRLPWKKIEIFMAIIKI